MLYFIFWFKFNQNNASAFTINFSQSCSKSNRSALNEFDVYPGVDPMVKAPKPWWQKVSKQTNKQDFFLIKKFF